MSFVIALLGFVFMIWDGDDTARNVGLSYGAEVTIALGTSGLAAALLAFLVFYNPQDSAGLGDEGIEQVFDDRSEHFSDEDWVNLINEASKHFIVLGTANHAYLQTETTLKPGLEQAIEDALVRGVIVKFYWLDPQSPQAKLRDDEENRATRRDAVESMAAFLAVRDRIKAKHPLRKNLCDGFKLYVYCATVTCGLTISDDVMVVATYLNRYSNKHTPGLVLRQASGAEQKLLFRGASKLFDAYMSHYRSVSGDSRCKTVDNELVAASQRSLVGQPKEPSEAET
jgi:hypothetical protein